MSKQTLFIALLVPLISGMVGCGGGGGDDVNITNDFSSTPVDPIDPNPPGDCAQVVLADFVSFNADCSVGTLSGTIEEDYTLLSEVQWRLDGAVVVGTGNTTTVNSDADVQAVRDSGVTLTIEPGTDIRAFGSGALLVTRGSILMADGSASQPITFSSLDDNYDGLGEWGGVILQGFAPQFGLGNTGPCYGSGTTCNVKGEGGDFVGNYGGNDDSDNSGVMRYVRIAEGGLVAGPNNEINGLSLQGVGSDTVLEYIQVYNNLDDGIEWFGGTVNLRYYVAGNNDDDDIDFDEGYRGNIQYALVQKNNVADVPQGSNDPRGVEANSSDASYVPQTEAVLANITIIGGKVNNNTASSQGPQPGMRLRGAVNTTVFNSSVSNFNIGCVRIDNADVQGDGSEIVDSVVGMVNLLGDCQDGLYPKQQPDPDDNSQLLTLTYSDTMAIQESQAQLAQAPTIVAVNNGSGFVFDQTNYVGAVDPNGDAWWQGWTLPNTVMEQEPVQPASFVECNTDSTICTVSGNINEDYTFVAGVEWRLSGAVVVGAGNVNIADNAEVQAIRNAGVTLKIRPGVQVRAFDDGVLLVTRGSKLNAVGSPAAPITFSSLDDGFDGEGEWGGVILQGFAPQYGKGGTGACFGSGTVCNVKGEGGSFVGSYAGNDPSDNSGALRYVRIAEGGLVAGPNNEINGLTLQGVGWGSTIDYVQVHNNLDDGIEWFGGTVNLTHLVLTNNDDDDIDFDEGYKGNIQFAIVQKNQTKTAPSGTNDPRGVEANSSDADFVPETDAVLANILIIGGPVNNNASSAEGQQPGMRLRGAVNVDVYNTAVENFDIGCIRIDDAKVNNVTVGTSDVNLVNVPGDCQDGYYQKRAANSAVNSGAATVSWDAAYALTSPGATVPAPGITAVNNGSGFVFDNTNYVGAVKPGTAAADAWWAGWIIEGSLD